MRPRCALTDSLHQLVEPTRIVNLFPKRHAISRRLQGAQNIIAFIHLHCVQKRHWYRLRSTRDRNDPLAVAHPDWLLKRERIVKCVELSNPAFHRSPVSATFHGRDIFAPAAAYIENGTPLEMLGNAFQRRASLILPQPVRNDAGLELHVLRTDHFGNLITDLTQEQYAQWNDRGRVIKFTVNNRTIHGLWSTFTDVPQGEPVAYFGSGGRLEIAVHFGRASDLLQLRNGSAIQLSFAD